MTWAVHPALVTTLAVTSLLGFATAPRIDGPGRFLGYALALALGIEALRSALQRPVVRADADGVEVVVGLTRRRYAWSEVEAVTTLQPPSSGGRLRRSANALEIDLGDRLVVVPAYRLGAPVTEVIDALAPLRLGSGGGF